MRKERHVYKHCETPCIGIFSVRTCSLRLKRHGVYHSFIYDIHAVTFLEQRLWVYQN